jgi:iron complex outermembrane receptor protein
VIIDADTGPFRHKLLLGFDYSREELADTGKSSPALDPPSWGGTFPTLDIFDPQFGLVDTSDFGPWLEEWKQVQHQTGLYIQDQIKLGGWVATLGLRQDWTRSTSRQDEVTKSEAEALTGRAGLTYLFDNGIAPFIGYATSFDPVSGYAFGNVPFDPTTGEQYEAGIKYAPRWFDGFFQVTVFDLTQQNILTPDPDPTHICGGFPCSIQTGEAQVRGFEFEAKTSPVPGLDVIVSYSYLDSEITKSNIDGEEGQPLHATPKHIASLWLFYTFQDGELVPGFGFGGGVRYRGDYYSNLAAGYPIDDVTLFDAALSYDVSKLDPKLAGLNLALNVNNVLDEEYLVSAQNWGALYGEGRSALVTMGYKW